MHFLFSNVGGITDYQSIINALFYTVVKIVHLKKVNLVFQTPLSKVFKQIIIGLCYKAIDLVFAIDITGSIGRIAEGPDQDDINCIIQFINSLVQSFTICSVNAHVGLLTFNTEVKIHTHLTDQKEIFDEQLKNVRDYCCSGKGATSLALQIPNEIFKGTPRQNISAKALVLLTDGSCSSNNMTKCSEIKNIAQRLENSGINILTVGIKLTRTE